MRDIKFRGKRVDNGEWVIGVPCEYTENTYEKDNTTAMVRKVSIDELDCWTDSVNYDLVSNNTVGQYTGLKDKNGVEIYEGDIVRFCGGAYCYGVWEYNSIETIKDIRNLSYFEGCEEITVIGNIHESEVE